MNEDTRANYVVLKFAQPLSKQQLDILSHRLTVEARNGTLPNCIGGYRALNNGFGHIVNGYVCLRCV